MRLTSLHARTTLLSTPAVRVRPLSRPPRPRVELKWHVGEVAAVTVDRRIELPLHRPQPRLLVNRTPAPLGVLAGLYARHDSPAAGTQV
jgi:hypothetical protein